MIKRRASKTPGPGRLEKLLLIGTALHAVVFFGKLVPETWVETLYARGFFPIWGRLIATPMAAVPFSVAEVLLAAMICLVLASVVQVLLRFVPWFRAKRPKGEALQKHSLRSAGLWRRTVVCMAILIHLYLLGFAWHYHRPKLVDRLGLPIIDARHVHDRMALQLAALARETRKSHGSEAICTLSTERLSLLAREALLSVLEELGAPPIPPAKLKSVWPKGLLMRFGVSGIFSPFTLEPHLDPALAPLEKPFVAIHEMAHLAGFAAEDEANFVAWLACQRSKLPCFRYSGTVAALRRFAEEAKLGLRKKLVELAGKDVLADMREARNRAKSLRVEVLSKISSGIYDKLLKSQGVAEGIRSYSAMTTLVASWHEHKSKADK